MTNILPFSEIKEMATAIAESGLFGAKTPAQAMSIMLIAQARGEHPASLIQDYHVINGRLAIRAEKALANFHKSNGKVEWDLYTNEEVSGTFSHPLGGTITLSWTMEDAKRAGLLDNKEKPWLKYPRAMLRSRLICEAIRTIWPVALEGALSLEEASDKFFNEKDITPVNKEIVTEKIYINTESICEIKNLCNELNVPDSIKQSWLDKANVKKLEHLSQDQADKLIIGLKSHEAARLIKGDN